MPVGEHGRKAMKNFVKEYGPKKGKTVAYKTANKFGSSSKLYSLLHRGK